MAPGLQAKAEEHGVAEQLTEIAAPPGDGGDPGDAADRLAGAMRDLAVGCADRGASCIVTGGGPLAGLAARIAPGCPVPIIDGTAVAVGLMRAILAGKGAPHVEAAQRSARI